MTQTVRDLSFLFTDTEQPDRIKIEKDISLAKIKVTEWHNELIPGKVNLVRLCHTLSTSGSGKGN